MKVSTTKEMSEILKSAEVDTIVFPENANIFLVDTDSDIEAKQKIEAIGRSCRRSLHSCGSWGSSNKTR